MARNETAAGLHYWDEPWYIGLPGVSFPSPARQEALWMALWALSSPGAATQLMEK